MGWGKCILILMGVPVLGVLLGALAARWRWVVDNDARLQWEATLATGAAAVTVAWLTVRRLQQQIGQTAELEEDRRQRRSGPRKRCFRWCLRKSANIPPPAYAVCISGRSFICTTEPLLGGIAVGT